MPEQSTLTLSSSTPEKTCKIAQSLVPMLTAGDVILLSGDVGAGKTHFARSFIQAALAQPEDVPSPTYTLIQTYDTGAVEIWHADLYRITDISEVEELGLLQAFTEAICFVEWPDRLGTLAPDNALNITLTPLQDDTARTLSFTWSDPRWDKISKELAHVGS